MLVKEGRGEWPGGAEGWPGAQGTTTREQQSPEVSGQVLVCGTDTTRHRACRCGPRGTVDGEREERGQKRACTLPSSWGRVHPNADPRKRGRGQKEGARQARWRRLPEQEQERQKSMQEGAEEGRGRKAPPGAAGPAGSSAPAPLGLVAWPAGRVAELPSSPFSEPGAASSRAWSPGSPQRGLRRS